MLNKVPAESKSVFYFVLKKQTPWVQGGHVPFFQKKKEIQTADGVGKPLGLNGWQLAGEERA
jgi:hypothetical protein